jgi:hypothetical protein
MEIAITAVLGIVSAILATYLYEKKIRDRTSVRRILDPNDKDIPRLIELYVELFPEESSNYSADDIIHMIEHQSHGTDFGEVVNEDFILVAKYKGDVVGFLFCHYYPERKKAIVSYYGIDKTILEARRSAANALLAYLNTNLGSKGVRCGYLFFDVERPDTASTAHEKVRRKARIIVLKQSARSFQRSAHCLDFEYTSPRITLSEGTKETPLTLMVIPLADPLPRSISRETTLEFLRFIYLDCYGDYYSINDEPYQAFRDYLSATLERYRGTLPEEIALILINF